MVSEKNAIEIVLVEDNPNDVELALRALSKHNLANKTIVLKDGKEALDYILQVGASAAAVAPKIILLDLKLPKIDGLQVLREIKGDERAKMIPVVVMTSSQEERDVVESYKLGVNSYIQKPIDFKKFVDIVEEIGYYWLLINKPPQ